MKKTDYHFSRKPYLIHKHYTYSINVTGDANEVITINFYLKNATVNSWAFVSQSSCTSCSNTPVSFNHSYTQYQIDNWSFKFNATDQHYNGYDLYGGSHIVDQDTIAIILLDGNNSYVNRSELQSGTSVRLAVRINDSDSQTNITDVSQSALYFYITNRTGNWIVQSESVNNTEGAIYYYLDFNPTCNYTAGAQNWNATAMGDLYFKNYTTDRFVLNIFGDLNSSYIYPKNLQIYERGTDIIFSGKLTDDCDNTVTDADVQYKLYSGTSTYYCRYFPCIFRNIK